MKKKILFAAIAIGAGVTFAGCGQASSTSTTEPDEAKSIALKAAGFKEADVKFVKTEQDFDDGIKKYEIEFINGDKEYSYEINMQTGEIIKQEVENVND